MKLNVKQIISAASVLLLLSACSRENDSNETESQKKSNPLVSALTGVTYGNYYGEIDYSASGGKYSDTSNQVLTETTYNGQGYFYDNFISQRFTYVGTMQIGAISVVVDTNISLYYRFSPTQWRLPINETQFGSNVTFSISGNVSTYTAASTSLYVPEELYIDTISCSCQIGYPEISLSGLPYEIRWNTDPQNQKGVVILIKYEGYESHQRDASLPSNIYFKPAITAPDNGSYDITAADLAGIPIGGIIDVYVARGNDDEMLSNGRPILINAYTYSKKRFIVVQ